MSLGTLISHISDSLLLGFVSDILSEDGEVTRISPSMKLAIWLCEVSDGRASLST